MDKAIEKHIDAVLHHLYINPLEKCNLKCKICYTRKTSPNLTEEQILDFIDRYNRIKEVKIITFCGGEVFALKYFAGLVNKLTGQGIFVQIITNGTIDTLGRFENPNSINLIVSIDGLQEYHDKNRGQGNFRKSVKFLKKARLLGFHAEIFSILTKQNLNHVDDFEKYFKNNLGIPDITYHPRKPQTYLTNHPISNIVGHIEGFDFLSEEELVNVMKTKRVFPPKELGCYQVAVASDGKIYGCCEGFRPIGTIQDQPKRLISALYDRIYAWKKSGEIPKCLGCSQHEFMCGIKSILEKIYE